MKKLLTAFLLLPTLAFAQQTQSPREQALTGRLIGEINNGLQCATDLLTLQREVARLTDELKAEKAKHEPPAPAKQ